MANNTTTAPAESRGAWQEIALRNPDYDPDSDKSPGIAARNAVRDTLYGVGIGNGLGFIVGKPALLVGLATTFAAHYFKAPALSSIGVGMMTSGLYNRSASAVAQRTISGAADKGGFPKDMDTVKNRFGEWKEFMKEKLFLDKLKKDDSGTDSQTPPSAPENPDPGIQTNLGAVPDPLDEIEAQLIQAALNYNGTTLEEEEATISDFGTPEGEYFIPESPENPPESDPVDLGKVIDFTHM